MADDDVMKALGEWANRVAAEFGIEPPAMDQLNDLLGVAGVAAHEVVRPAAPVTTFLIGYAMAADASLSLSAAVAAVKRLAGADTADA